MSLISSFSSFKHWWPVLIVIQGSWENWGTTYGCLTTFLTILITVSFIFLWYLVFLNLQQCPCLLITCQYTVLQIYLGNAQVLPHWKAARENRAWQGSPWLSTMKNTENVNLKRSSRFMLLAVLFSPVICNTLAWAGAVVLLLYHCRWMGAWDKTKIKINSHEREC